MSITWTNEKIPESKKNNPKAKEMVDRLVWFYASQSFAVTSSAKSSYSAPTTWNDEPDRNEDHRSQAEIDFDNHVAEMETWLVESGLNCIPTVMMRFEEFKRNRNYSAATYYDRGDALADYEYYTGRSYGI